MVRAALALAALPPLAFFAWACACGGCHPSATPPAPVGRRRDELAAPGRAAGETSAGETVVRLEDDGKSLEVAVGSTVTFRLASHGGTGYVWVPRASTAATEGCSRRWGSATSEASSDAPGAPKLDVLRFVARHAGTATVEMGLVRPWGNQPP